MTTLLTLTYILAPAVVFGALGYLAGRAMRRMTEPAEPPRERGCAESERLMED